MSFIKAILPILCLGLLAGCSTEQSQNVKNEAQGNINMELKTYSVQLSRDFGVNNKDCEFFSIQSKEGSLKCADFLTSYLLKTNGKSDWRAQRDINDLDKDDKAKKILSVKLNTNNETPVSYSDFRTIAYVDEVEQEKYVDNDQIIYSIKMGMVHQEYALVLTPYELPNNQYIVSYAMNLNTSSTRMIKIDQKFFGFSPIIGDQNQVLNILSLGDGRFLINVIVVN